MDPIFHLAPIWGSLADPPVSSVLVPAVSWFQGTLLGTVAISVAVIATACVGLMMLGGRIDLRSGVAVILGCFVLFGAATIAAGIRSAAGNGAAETSYSLPPPPPPAPPTVPPPAGAAGTSAPAASDPHAGASVPQP